MKNVTPLLLPLFLMATILSCKKDYVQPKPLTGTFEIKEIILSPAFRFVETYDTDSVSTREVEFIANEPEDFNIRYEWKIGSDSRVFTGRNLKLDFQYSFENYIEITLTIKKGDSWNPSNTQLKTSTRICYLRRKPIVLGTFEGNFENDSRKTTLKIQDNFTHPISLLPGKSTYKGLLITEDGNRFDSLFLTTVGDPYDIINRKLTFRKTTIIRYADYLFNRKIEGPVGEISVDANTSKVTMDIKARNVTSGQEVNLRFSGIKIN